MVMDMEITAAVLRDGDAPYSLERIELGGPGAGEVLVRIAAVGMCHSDALLRSQAFGAKLPIIPGHEGAGIVESVGAAVDGVKRGDHVVLTFDSCGLCRNCTENRPALCTAGRERNMVGWKADGSSTATGTDGAPIGSRWFAQSSFATHAIATSRNVVVVDDKLPLHVLAPLGCGIQTGAGAVLNSLDVQPGSSLAVFGAGAVGLAAVLAGAVAGAETIVVVDLHPERRELAVEFGATHVLDGAKDDVLARSASSPTEAPTTPSTRQGCHASRRPPSRRPGWAERARLPAYSPDPFRSNQWRSPASQSQEYSRATRCLRSSSLDSSTSGVPDDCPSSGSSSSSHSARSTTPKKRHCRAEW